ncbi:hypothetical protein QE152_g13650 [Popillia japonica]|uniref:Uncharacterized protein n=1 Tax=Popillia japonica TaxID=7064 RepID=A0AAW1LAI5_POPJA
MNRTEGNTPRDTAGDSPWQHEEMTSPIYRLYVSDDNDSIADTDSPFAKKRKRETYNVKHIEKEEDRSTELTEVLTFMEKLYNKTDSLRKQVKKSTKTKTEIKSTTRELVNIVGILRKKMTNLKAKHAELAAKSTEYGKQATLADAQIGECLAPKVPDVTKKPITEAVTSNVHGDTARVMSSTSTQTDWEDVEVVRMQRDNEVRNNVRMVMADDTGFQNLAKVIDVDWPEDMFPKTVVWNMNPSSLNSEGDLAILVDPREADHSKILENISIRYPEILDMVRKNEGQIDYLTNTTSTRVRGKEIEEKTTTVYLLPVKICKDGFNDIEEVYKVIRDLKDIYQHHPPGKLNITVPNELNLGHIRKICEYVFGRQQIAVTLITLTNNAKQVPRRPHNQRTTEKIVVKSGSTKYADLLKTVKDNVDLDRVGVHVKTIRKTRQGDLMLEVSGDRDKASALKAAIRKKVDNKVSVLNNEMTIHALDIDAVYTKEDAEDAIRNAAKIRDPQTIRVKSMRPTRDDRLGSMQSPRKDRGYEVLQVPGIWSPKKRLQGTRQI